jgi:hypothetical protein
VLEIFFLMAEEQQGRCLPGVGQEFAVAGRSDSERAELPDPPSRRMPLPCRSLPSAVPPSHHMMAYLACAAAPPACPCPARAPINEALITRPPERRQQRGQSTAAYARCPRRSVRTPATTVYDGSCSSPRPRPRPRAPCCIRVLLLTFRRPPPPAPGATTITARCPPRHYHDDHHLTFSAFPGASSTDKSRFFPAVLQVLTPAQARFIRFSPEWWARHGQTMHQ